LVTTGIFGGRLADARLVPTKILLYCQNCRRKLKKKGKRKKENREVKRMCFFVCKTERFYIVGLIKIMGRSLKEDLNSSRCRVFFEKGYLVME
jgi:hypothetical protein